MSRPVWTVCAIWLAVTLAVAVARGITAARKGRTRAALTRLKSPTVYLFAAYLLVAALVTPLSEGESTSPLLWLALTLPLAYAASTIASAAQDRPPPALRAALAALFGGAVLAASFLILAVVSPAFVPRWLR